MTRHILAVVPYIGTWIETPLTDCQNCFGTVVPYIGTWIETQRRKFNRRELSVVPYIGTWIETRTQSDFYKVQMSYLI